ncbi:MAG: Nramp family divalent metal transporter, partial [Planctomycetota bacterium]|nr:Nramp family divalent metal transporter [Planctomycetota bacterium]
MNSKRADNNTQNDIKIQDPPTTVLGILKQLGPGLIIAGSIVGSGELIATTAVGAEAGFTLMWLIIVGCMIKVFAQIEFGRYTLIHGRTTLDGLNEVPGPRFGVNWILWYWLVMFLVSLAQLGGIVGGVGQAVTISAPLTQEGKAYNRYQELLIEQHVTRSLITRPSVDSADPDSVEAARLQKRLEALTLEIEEVEQPFRRTLAYQEAIRIRRQLEQEYSKVEEGVGAGALEKDRLENRLMDAEKTEQSLRGPSQSNDEILWATLITISSMVILVLGRYQLIQLLSTVLVAGFTFVTIANLIHLQTLPEWRVGWDDLVHGLSFQFPSTETGMTTALMAFGIIGVGATELIQYPYWCLEKGYAKWVGPRDSTDAWAARARGWLRVMRWDAWASMLVYTFATVAFYLLGAAVLKRAGLNPEGSQMVRTLAEMYVPVFGKAAHAIFLIGAFAVLYSTFFVANASNARVCADAMRVFGFSKGTERAQKFWLLFYCGLLPALCLIVYVFVRAPKQLVLASGLMQAIMLPMLAIAALYFRYRRLDQRLMPSLGWDFG